MHEEQCMFSHGVVPRIVPHRLVGNLPESRFRKTACSVKMLHIGIDECIMDQNSTKVPHVLLTCDE